MASLVNKIIADYLEKEGYLSKSEFEDERREFPREKINLPVLTFPEGVFSEYLIGPQPSDDAHQLPRDNRLSSDGEQRSVVVVRRAVQGLDPEAVRRLQTRSVPIKSKGWQKPGPG